MINKLIVSDINFAIIKSVFLSENHKAQKIKGKKSRRPLAWRRTQMLLFTGCMVSSVFSPDLSIAQEALRNSIAGESASLANRVHPDSIPYTFKTGDLRILATPSLGFDYNDNVTLGQAGGGQSDFILKPAVQITVSYPLSQQNLLSLNVGVGYNRYFEHSELSSLSLTTGSGLSFDMYIKDVWINFHDRVGYSQDSSQNPLLAGSASAGLATLNNTVGVSPTWDLEDVTLSTGYDHGNTISFANQSSASQFNSQDQTTESIFGRVGFKLNPRLTTGLESTAAFTKHDQNVLNDNSIYTIGVYGDWQPGSYFHISPRVGYSLSEYGHSSSSVQTAGQASWYANLSISHQPTEILSYSLDFGKQTQNGIQSDAVETYTVGPSVTLHIFKNVGLSASFSYENGTQGAGNISGNLTESFNYYNSSISANYSLTKKLNLSLNYRNTLRSSSGSTLGYTQNLIGLLLTYHQ